MVRQLSHSESLEVRWEQFLLDVDLALYKNSGHEKPASEILVGIMPYLRGLHFEFLECKEFQLIQHYSRKVGPTSRVPNSIKKNLSSLLGVRALIGKGKDVLKINQFAQDTTE